MSQRTSRQTAQQLRAQRVAETKESITEAALLQCIQEALQYRHFVEYELSQWGFKPINERRQRIKDVIQSANIDCEWLKTLKNAELRDIFHKYRVDRYPSAIIRLSLLTGEEEECCQQIFEMYNGNNDLYQKVDMLMRKRPDFVKAKIRARLAETGPKSVYEFLEDLKMEMSNNN